MSSEKFPFLFALTVFGFFPSEPRDSIFLNGKGAEPTHNRTSLEAAQAATLNFTGWLLARNARNLFVLASMRIPKTTPSM